MYFVRALRSVVEFITGGSIAAPAGLACAIVAAIAFPHARGALFAGIVALAFIASVFERPS